MCVEHACVHSTHTHTLTHTLSLIHTHTHTHTHTHIVTHTHIHAQFTAHARAHAHNFSWAGRAPKGWLQLGPPRAAGIQVCVIRGADTRRSKKMEESSRAV